MISPSKSGSKTARCPICNNLQDKDYAPFCSKRCADIDLHRWLSGGYAIPAVEGADEGADEENYSAE